MKNKKSEQQQEEILKGMSFMAVDLRQTFFHFDLICIRDI